MKDQIIKALEKTTKLPKNEIENLLEVPPSPELGDYAFPCFSLAKKFKKAPAEIAQELSKQLSKTPKLENIEAKGPYINFFVNKKQLVEETLTKISKEKEKYGSSKTECGKKAVIEFSSVNVAKKFGIGHLRSTIIGNAISNIKEFTGYKITRINYLGDWGTPFGKIIAGYKKFGSEKELEEDPINHLYRIYVKTSSDKSFEQEGREEFSKLEQGDKENTALWKKFRDLSIKAFRQIYKKLGVEFDVYSGESFYTKKMQPVIKKLGEKNLLKKSEGAYIVDLKEKNLGVVLIKKSDGTTLYATRDLAAAIDRYKKFKFDEMYYEVGSEQKLHFKQFFTVLKMMGHKFADNCHHIDHGLYLDSDGKKFATRKGKTSGMNEIIRETENLALTELKKRSPDSKQPELEKKAELIARAAILYGDLKNFRGNDMVFDIKQFMSFEGNTGPYLLYTYARARSILHKAKYKKSKLSIPEPSEEEKQLTLQLAKFPEIVLAASKNLAPHTIANYSYDLAKQFNEFYHKTKIIGSENEQFGLALVDSFSQVLKNALNLLGIEVLEQM